MCAVTCLRKTKSDSVNAIRGQEHADCEAMLPLSSKHQIAKQSVTVGPSKSSVQAGDLLCAKALRPAQKECPASCHQRALGHPRFRLRHVDGRERGAAYWFPQDAALQSSRKLSRIRLRKRSGAMSYYAPYSVLMAGLCGVQQC